MPFITAYEGLREAGGVKAGDVVLVLGANGKVGQAAIQLATMAGARVFAVERTAEPYRGHASGPVEMIDADAADIAAQVRELTGGHGADIVYNTVGCPYFEAANQAMAVQRPADLHRTIERAVPFDIFAFYRGRHRYVGIDTLALDSGECAAILDALKPGFESGKLRPFPVLDDHCFALEDAAAAYRAVLRARPSASCSTPSLSPARPTPRARQQQHTDAKTSMRRAFCSPRSSPARRDRSPAPTIPSGRSP